MIRFSEITYKEAMEMIENKDLKNLYFKTHGTSIAGVENYTISFDTLAKKQYFKKEEVK